MRLVIFVTTIFVSLNAMAENMLDCTHAETQSQYTRCAKQSSLEHATMLEDLVIELKSVLPEKPEENLVESQLAWEKVVENDCLIESWYLEGGSARHMIVSKCFSQHTKMRIEMLAPLLCHPMKFECEAKLKYVKNRGHAPRNAAQ